jgi:anti-sigma regulatory factor (Ser/Thr protein kinase)
MKIRNYYGISQRVDELVQNLKELDEALHEDKRHADLCKAEFVTPLSILPLAVFASHNRMKITYSEENYDIQSYLGTIGFPKGFEELPSDEKRYLPITRLPPIEQNKVLGKYEDLILEMSDSNEYASSFKLSLKYLTSELVNNVSEHANIDQYWLLAQYWEKPHRACEIVIADCGIGYKQSYEGTRYEVKSDMEAIINALEGKSSKKENLRGYGIPTIARLFVQGYGGKLIIMSGKSIVYDKQGQRKVWKLKSHWQGSLVGINFNLKKIQFYKYLRQARRSQ